MKAHTVLRTLPAAAGAAAMLAMGLLAVSTAPSSGESAPSAVLAPVTDLVTVQVEEAEEVVTTTSSPASYSPTVTATIPPPPDYD